MSDFVFHIGHTKVAVASRFGVPTLAVCQIGGDYERVGSFDSDVQASRFVDALRKGLQEEGIDIMSWRVKPPEEPEPPPEPES